MKKFALVFILILVAGGTLEVHAQRSLKELRAKLAEPFDTTRDASYWKRALLHGKLDIQDSSVTYPKTLQFVLDVYKWGDYAFNHYDSTYVVGTGKKWKLMVNNNNFMDTYVGHLTSQEILLHLNSNIFSTFGFQLSFMALSAGYTFNVSNLITGNRVKNKKWDFSFTCSRIAVDAYYYNDESEVNLLRLGSYKSGPLNTYKFDGLKRYVYGLHGYYFFNHLRYAQAAAYSFSKIQKRSAGSIIAGVHASHQNIDMNFYKLNDFLQQNLPEGQLEFRFRYNDFSALFGYGYNWVFHRNWLYNVTFTSGVGYRHILPNSIDEDKNMMAFNYRLKMAFVLNRGNFFYGAHFMSDGRWYHSPQCFFFNTAHNLNFTAGFRF